jgi:hypothetical protein
MRGALILILGIVSASIALVLIAGLVIAPEENIETPVAQWVGRDRLVIKSISLNYPSGFALVTRSDQLPVNVDIPVCDLGFDYCFYDERNGLRINVSGIKSEDACVNSSIGPVERVVGEHYSYGYIYRIFVEDNCYEFETRLIQEAGKSHNKSALSKLNTVIESASLGSSGERVFPAP